MNKSGKLIKADIDFYSVVPLIALLGLLHLGISLHFFVFGGAGSGDQGGISGHPLSHSHALSTEVLFDDFNNLIAQRVLLKQVAGGQDRCHIWNTVTDQIVSCNASHGGNINHGLLHSLVVERIPLLQQMDAQHRYQWIRRTATLLVHHGLKGLDQFDQCLPKRHPPSSSNKILTFDLIFELVSY